MEDTILTSLRGAERKLLEDGLDLEERIVNTINKHQKRQLLIQLMDVHFKLAAVTKQIYDLIMEPEQKKTFWQKLFNR